MIWRRSKMWLADQADWRWPFNKFSITIKTNPTHFQLLAGVQFHAADFEKILRQRKRSNGGAPTKDNGWTSFWMAVLELSQEGRLNARQFNSQLELRAELLHMIGDELSDRTIKERVSQIWKRFVSDGNVAPSE